MKNSGIRWKGLSDSKTERNINEPFPEKSKSKSKKYNPMRSPTVSHLHIKMKSINKSKENDENDQNLYNLTDVSAIEIGEISPSKTEESFFKCLKKRETTIRNSIFEATEFNLMKKLLENCQIEKSKEEVVINQNETNKNNIILYEQFLQIKNDFIKFKEIVQNEICKQNEYLKQMVKNIYEELSKTILKYNHLDEQKKKEENKDIDEMSLDFRDINRIDEVCKENTQYFNRVLKDYNLQLDESLKNSMTFSHYRHQRNKSDIGSLQRESQISSSSKENDLKKSMTVKNLEINNKKQFEKLFEAVDCLKRDIKDWNELGTSPKEETQKTKNNLLKPPRTAGKCSQFITLRKSSFLMNKSKIEFI